MTLIPRQLLPVLFWLVAGLVAPAQESEDPQVPTTEEVQARIEALQDSESPEKDELLDLYGQTLQALERTAKLVESALEYRQQAEEAPARLEALTEELASPAEKENPEVPSEITLRELEQQEEQADADRLSAMQLVDDLAEEAKHRSSRVGFLPEEIANARAKATELGETQRAAKIGDELDEAQRLLVIAELEATRALERQLEAEHAAYEASRGLLALKRDRAQRQRSRAEQLLLFWQERTASCRKEESEQAASAAASRRLEIAERFPELVEIARKNEELAAERTGAMGIAEQMSRASTALLEAQNLRDEVARRFTSTARKIEVAGKSQGMGLLLRREFEWTESPSRLRAESRARKAALSRTQLRMIELEEARESEGDLTTQHEELMASLGPTNAEADTEQLSALARELLESRRQLRTSLIDELGRLIETLEDHERVYRELFDSTVAYRDFISEHILWMPSTVGGPLPDPGHAADGLKWLFTSPDWADGVDRSLVRAKKKWGKSLFLMISFSLLVLFRRRFRRTLVQTADQVRSYRTARFGHTMRALGATMAFALPAPMLLWSIGWFLSSPSVQVEVAYAVGTALELLSYTLLVLAVLRQLTLPNNLGEAHFRWPRTSLDALRTELNWFIPTVLSVEFLVLTFDHQSSEIWNDSAGQAAFIAQVVAFIVLLARLSRPRVELLAGYYRRHGTLLERTEKLWFSVLLAVPVTLLILAISGYFYTALQLETYVRHSIGLGIALLLASALASRWLFIERRRMTLEQARQRAQAQTSETADEDQAPDSIQAPVEVETIDVPAIEAQTRQLFRRCILIATLVGLFFIWADAFPATRALDKVQLWPEFLGAVESVDDEVPEVVNGSVVPEVASQLPDASTTIAVSNIVSLADVILALLIFVLTAVATKNAPGLLEIAVLQRLPLDTASRFALTTLFRYVLLCFGLTLGFGAIGIGWSEVQWLAAALTFGLAFGLQEIFANLVSGIIILLERPVRTGDIVTVAGTMGRITKLRMRATTILDWDRREMLVPNKEFITGSLVNWTLSDPVTRIVIPVGIAYGSDTRKARELLLKIAVESELVVDDPRPNTAFLRFGESSLDLELRVFIADRDHWVEAISGLHTEIDDAFHEAGIEIAFPQRDVHVRTAEGLRDGRGGAGEPV